MRTLPLSVMALVVAVGVVAACRTPRVDVPTVVVHCTDCDRKPKPPPDCPVCPACPDAGTPPTDGGTQPPTDGGTEPPTDGGTVPPVGSGRLHTQGNGIYDETGARWHGKGANLADTRSCNACAYNPPNAAEVMRRADELVAWGASFIRLDLESYASSGGRMHWADFQNDPQYLADILTIVRHIQAKPGVYVLVSLWAHPSIGAEGRPTQATADAWRFLAHELRNEPKVFFGVINEPENNYDGSGDQAVWNAMNTVVQAIRQQEAQDGVAPHLVAVQGTGGWARLLNYYITHPIPGGNVIYETHVYNPQSDFNNLVTTPAQTLPVVIGEFGPWSGLMSLNDTQALMTLADSLKVPWAAWTFHMRCSPNLLVDYSQGGCGVGMALEATEFGNQVKQNLQRTRR